MRITMGLLIVASVLVQGADAGPVLLASYEREVGGEVAPESDPRVEFILQLPGTPEAPDAADQPGLGQGLDLFWESGASGSFDFTAKNDPNFAPFAAASTDGLEDEFVLWGLFPSRSGAGGSGMESDLFGTSADLVGYQLEFVRLTVDGLTIAPFQPTTGIGPGFQYDGRVRYDFYGSVVPEPATALLLLMGWLGSIAWRRRASKTRVPTSSVLQRVTVVTIIACLTSLLPVPSALAQCVAGGQLSFPGLNGGQTNPHSFTNQCLAASGTSVTLTIEAMADLGCNSFDGVNNPPVGGQCPTACTPICCDTAPAAK